MPDPDEPGVAYRERGRPKVNVGAMSVTRPRGPLPARVYWFRRTLVLGLAGALVLGIGQVLDTGADGATEQAARTSAGVTSTESESESAAQVPQVGPSAVSTADSSPTTKRSKKPARKKTKKPLPMPTGPCQDSDVRVEPATENTNAADSITIELELTTFSSPACTWQVSPDTLAVRLTSGSDRIWSSQQCPAAVPTQSVVLRKRTPKVVEVTWSGRRSDAECSKMTDWALPGYYHVSAAALGAEPQSQQFRLLPPVPLTMTPTPTPRPKGKEKAQEKKRDRQSDED